MPRSHPPRRRARLLAALAAAAVAGATLAAVPSEAADGHGQQVARPAFAPGRYVVMLREPAAAAHGDAVETLGIASAEVADYRTRLHREQTRVARSVGAAVDRRWTLAANGFSARLTARQAEELAGHRGVLFVAPEGRRSLDTWSTPGALGLTGTQGAWRRDAGGRGKAGRGVVVGVIDSGLWPGSASFRGRPLTAEPRTRWRISRTGETVRMRKADGSWFEGRCQLGHVVDGVTVPARRWTADSCTTKVVGARYYPEEFLEEVPPAHRSPHEVISSRDGNGHGTHTAGTAVGRTVRNVTVEGVRFGTLSGMAPAARLATYKACFDDDDLATGDCFDGAVIAAIEDAVADGVDVLNLSVSGARDTVLDPIELALEGAAEAGVFVATTAGNAGPAPSSVSHNSPWVTTVAATTHATFENTVRLGNGRSLRGASISRTPLPTTPLVDSLTAVARGATPAEAELCLPGSLAERHVRGRIVVCTRGTSPRVEKSAVVADAGGVGMVLANVEPGSVDADFHSVPTVHLARRDAVVVLDYLRRAGSRARAALLLGDRTGRAPRPVPQVAGFSSRGPAAANDSDLLKPDLAAPGASVLAAVAPPANEGRRFDLYSGTSMAAPHVAGLAAFILGERPGWTPMKVKSAMMTTAAGVRTASGGRERDGFAQGAGQVRPRRFLDPGLFVVSTPTDWRRFTQGQGLDWGAGHRPLAAKDLNVPSLAEGEVAGRTSFRREFLAARAGTWRVSVHVPGFSATSARRLVADGRGDRRTLRFDFERTTAPLGRFAHGYVVLDGPTRVRLPVALRPVSVDAPDEVRGSGTEGTLPLSLTAGRTGTVAVDAAGLVPATTRTGVVETVRGDYDDELYYCFFVGEGSRAARFDVEPDDDRRDLDLMVIPVDDTCREQTGTELLSAGPSPDERVTLLDPAPGWYVAAVDPVPTETEGPLGWRLDVYDVHPELETGTFTVDPEPVPVVAGRATTVQVRWSGLQPGARHLGMLTYEGALSPTFVTVDPAP
ncbi:MAG TPA: S8 family serine peptidase [Nocardioides sp.]|nr:S8 family serine peptidase [Nocardioides sp.]